MQPPETLLKGLRLETVTPAEALSFIRELACTTLPQMSADYYVRRLRAAELVAEAALRKSAGRPG